MGFYDQSVTAVNGDEISMKDYEGKVVLVVNTATGCGFTPHYDPLEAMYKEMRDQGFEILDFPCNQFGEQAPGTMEEIRFSSGCTGKKVSKGSARGAWQRPWTRCSDPRMPTMRQSLRSNGTLRNS